VRWEVKPLFTRLRQWWRRFVRRHIIDDDPMDNERMRHDPAYRERIRQDKPRDE
jgi:hypothetical protein